MNEISIKSNYTDYLYIVCKEYPLMVINTECGTGKYHFNCIGYKSSKLLLEFQLIIDDQYKDSEIISSSIGNKYYLTVNQFLIAYKSFASA